MAASVQSKNNVHDDLDLEQFKFVNKKCCQAEITHKILEIAYDIFTVVVSLLDVITDVMVLIHFYTTNRMTFFYISLSILIIAQLAYTMAFWWKFTDSSYNSAGSALFACCCLLPFSPLLSYAFYFTSNDSTPLYKFFDRLFNFECEMRCCSTSNSNKKNKKNDKQHALRQWVEDKLMKHLGFIIEALIEAFPQSILQLIAIVYYNDTHNYVSIFSILLSMISVSTKSFILSVKISYNWKSAIFNWIACLIDFVSIFCITSLIFYVPNDMDYNPFYTLQQMWLYSSAITVIPFTVIGSTVLMSVYLFDNPSCDFDWFVALFLIVVLWIIGLCLTTMLMMIAAFAVFALILIHLSASKRLGKHCDLYMPLASFVSSAKSVHVRDYYEDEVALKISKKQHEVIRMCCINRVLLEQIARSDTMWNYNSLDHKLHKYLREEAVAADIPYINATFEGLQMNSDKLGRVPAKKGCAKWVDAYAKVPKYFYDEFQELNQYNICGTIALYLCLPLYFIGRCFNTLFIFFMICYLFIGFNINVFSSDIPSFQTVMLCCYLSLVVIWSVLLYFVLNEQQYLSLILPNESILKLNFVSDVSGRRQIMNYYHSVISQLVAQRYCIRLFGKDVTSIIMQLWGEGDDEFVNIESV